VTDHLDHTDRRQTAKGASVALAGNQAITTRLFFFGSFNGFAGFGLRRVHNVAGITLIHVNHTKRARPCQAGVLDRQKMLFGFAEQKNGEMRIASV
jgi:hypothetical protein